jgi:hypothetical protein
VCLDPRVAVLDPDGRVAYDPRQTPGPLAPVFADWLAAHPEWPRVATEAAS